MTCDWLSQSGHQSHYGFWPVRNRDHLG